MSYVAIQIGARRNYAVPGLLERAGMLEHFYTDICGDVGLGRILSNGRNLPWIGSGLQRLSGRTLPAGVASKTTTFPISVLKHMTELPLARNAGDSHRAHIRWTDAIGDKIVKRGFGHATHVYSMLGECAPALAAAKRTGLRMVTEIYISLSSDRIVAEERRLFPNWEPESPDYDKVRNEMRTEFTMLENTDIAICPAESVAADLVCHFGFPKERTTVIPYGVDAKWLAVANDPVPGRILFVGSACLRKGIHHLAMASALLNRGGAKYDFRVAGDVTPRVASQEACGHLNFLGRVPRHLIHREFQQADLFVIPSLAEGSAEVTYQALAAGVPVITTAESGSVVRDGIEGRIVRSRDPGQLAQVIADLVGDRPRRDSYARAAKQRAFDFSGDRYSERLLSVLRAA